MSTPQLPFHQSERRINSFLSILPKRIFREYCIWNFVVFFVQQLPVTTTKEICNLGITKSQLGVHTLLAFFLLDILHNLNSIVLHESFVFALVD